MAEVSVRFQGEVDDITGFFVRGYDRSNPRDTKLEYVYHNAEKRSIEDSFGIADAIRRRMQFDENLSSFIYPARGTVWYDKDAGESVVP